MIQCNDNDWLQWSYYDDTVATDNVKHVCILGGMFLKLETHIQSIDLILEVSHPS